MEDSFFQTMKLTFELAGVTTLTLLFIGIPLGYFLSQTKSKIKPVIETLVSMPLVLPPSVLGFYLLLAFSPKNSFGSWLEETFDLRLVFSFEGLIIASVIFSLPFMVHPIQSGFSSLSKSLKEASFVLGKSRLETLFYVLLPNIKPSLLTGIVISFAHTVGEFGVVLMIGGNIAGETKLASIAIYDEVEALNYDLANQYAFTLFIISFVILLFVYMINKKMLKSEFIK
ncbi:MAG: molybdate ABC transporter permease subunit [Aliarcobacter skirrowii]|uniref:molybdate ABC transporter permease subunit n=1 Tax=Aliarcobacter skirrowii TaxID=28200 RepID=UPI002431144E|nr:molybdate ABC transporter permease subunit [Aliarcobacter skirrowii]MDD2507484.1 molybdate ABC transporter permease subunit [Aliarcobacter skirrowii]MDD3495836.1 molybdate ABC transporter permease subunit [Aliarcobacter skirrowii]